MTAHGHPSGSEAVGCPQHPSGTATHGGSPEQRKLIKQQEAADGKYYSHSLPALPITSPKELGGMSVLHSKKEGNQG